VIERTLSELARQVGRLADAVPTAPKTGARRRAPAASGMQPSQSQLLPGSHVVVHFNPHDEEACDIVGEVVSFQPGAGFMGCDLVYVRYEHPRDGSIHELPFAAYNLELGDRDSLFARAARHEEQAARLRAMADRVAP
jgi:hypothetical protein